MMGIEGDVAKAGEATVVATGVLSIVFYAIKRMVRSASADLVGLKQDTAQKNTLDSLHDEIGRLKASMAGMQDEIILLKKQQMHFRNKLVKAQIALIDVEFYLTSCTCDKVVTIRAKLAEVRRTLLEGEIDESA